MSILLIGLEDSLTIALGKRLISAGDEVRILVTAQDDDRYRRAGLHVARGQRLDDDDLIERAAQNVRTIVVGELPRERLTAVLKGAGAAGAGRIISVLPTPSDVYRELLAVSPLEYTTLVVGRTLITRKPKLTEDEVAAAVDAADDLAEGLRVELDLGTDEAWGVLRLPVPRK
jgi:hypothetical protein